MSSKRLTAVNGCCELDDVPFDLHAICRCCGALAGGEHPAGPLVDGLCLFCRQMLAKWPAGRAWPPESASQETAIETPSNCVLLNANQAARMLNISTKTLGRLVKRRRLTRVYLSERPRYRLEEIRELLRKQESA